MLRSCCNAAILLQCCDPVGIWPRPYRIGAPASPLYAALSKKKAKKRLEKKKRQKEIKLKETKRRMKEHKEKKNVFV